MKRVHKLVAANVAGLVALLAVWQLASVVVGPYWMPAPLEVLERLWSELQRGKLHVDLVATGRLVVFGVAIGLVGGVGTAFVLRLSSRLDQMLQPYISAMMSVPKLGLVPLIVLWFGTGWTPKIMLVALTTYFIVFALTYSGLSTVDQRLVMLARVMGANSFQVTREIVLPTVWPFILTGLEVALPWAVSAALVAEFLAAQVGLGFRIESARQMSDSVGVFYGIVMATLLVLAGNAVLALARRAGRAWR